LALLSACDFSQSPKDRGGNGAPVTTPNHQSNEEGRPLSQNITEQRLALVIGNSDYLGDFLPNPSNDAKDIANLLRGYGFTVIHKQNLNQEQMDLAIIDFGQRLSQGGVGLFYFAGHGIQINQHNYLIPIGPKIPKARLVKYRAIDAQFVVDLMQEAGSRVNIVIFDACRNNPYRSYFRSQDGLTAMTAPQGTIISYATALGQQASDGNGRNGLFTQYLLKAIQTPGLTIEEVFKQTARGVQQESSGKQVPWRLSSLTDDFCFTTCAKRTTVDKQQALQQAETARKAEEQRLAQLRQQQQAAETARKAEEQRLAQLRQQQAEKARKAEEQRLAQLRQQQQVAETARKAEEQRLAQLLQQATLAFTRY